MIFVQIILGVITMSLFWLTVANLNIFIGTLISKEPDGKAFALCAVFFILFYSVQSITQHYYDDRFAYKATACATCAVLIYFTIFGGGNSNAQETSHQEKQND